MQFFATIVSMACAIAAVSAHNGEAHYTNATSTVAPPYGTSNTTIGSTGTGAPFASSTGTLDSGAGKISASALGLLFVGGVVLTL